MKAKNQPPYTSESDAREKLIIYVYEYLCKQGAKQAADVFKDTIGYHRDIKVSDTNSFLDDWWTVFWDLYCAAPERRHNQPEPSSDARAFMDNMRLPMSPSIAQQSPPQHMQQPPGPPQFMGAPRYGPPPPGAQPRGPMPRMQGPMSHGSPHPGGPPPPNSFSPRYAPHPGPPPPQPHMNQGMMFSPGPEHQMGPSPGLNRMTPVGEPSQGVVGPPPNGPPPPQMVGMPGQQMGGPGQGPPPPQVMQGNGPPRDGSQGPGNVNYNVNSPVNPACYSGPGEPSTPHSEEYVMPGPFGQEPTDHCDNAEIMKIKQSMQDDTSKMFEKEQSDYSLNDYPPEGKWS